MKKNIKRTLDKTPLITIAINNDVKEDYIRAVRSAGYSFGS